MIPPWRFFTSCPRQKCSASNLFSSHLTYQDVITLRWLTTHSFNALARRWLIARRKSQSMSSPVSADERERCSCRLCLIYEWKYALIRGDSLCLCLYLRSGTRGVVLSGRASWEMMWASDCCSGKRALWMTELVTCVLSFEMQWRRLSHFCRFCWPIIANSEQKHNIRSLIKID